MCSDIFMSEIQENTKPQIENGHSLGLMAKESIGLISRKCTNDTQKYTNLFGHFIS